MAATTATKSGISDDVAAKVAKLLSSSKPEEVAAAVKILERNSVQAQRAVTKLNRGETGTIMGTMTAFPPTPVTPDATVNTPDDIDLEQNIPGSKMTGPDIEADIKAKMNKTR